MSRNNECCICYGTVSAGNKITTECNHEFHNTCLAKWLLVHDGCPLCRNDLCKTDKEKLELTNYEPNSQEIESHSQGRARPRRSRYRQWHLLHIDYEPEIESHVIFQGIGRPMFSWGELCTIANWENDIANDIMDDNDLEYPLIPNRHLVKFKPLYTKGAIMSLKVQKTFFRFNLYVNKKEKSNVQYKYNHTKNKHMTKHPRRKCMGKIPSNTGR